MAFKRNKADKRFVKRIEEVVNRTLSFWLLIGTIRDEASAQQEEWRAYLLAELQDCQLWDHYGGLTRQEITTVIDTIAGSLSWQQIVEASDDKLKNLFSWGQRVFTVPR